MKNVLAFLLSILVLFSCSESAQPPLSTYEQQIKKHRKETHDHFLSKEGPLLEEDRKNFLGLSYYPIDSAYAFWAPYQKFEQPDTVMMPTNTERFLNMVEEGKLSFSIADSACELYVYYDVDRLKAEGVKEYFIPFSDETSSFETYGGGRYLEIDSMKENGAFMWLDFNMCYNPYCAYNHNFSCPLPPAKNNLNVKIEAGEKKFH